MSLRMSRRFGVLRLLVAAVLIPFALSCATVAQITTLSDPACQQSLKTAFSRIFESEGEPPDVASALAESTATALQDGGLGPRPFLVEAPSGVDYSFFVEPKDKACLLRLYGRQKGFTSYTNNITYIATESLAPCQCSE